MMLENNTLKRELGLLDSTLIVIGSMVGSGIFIVSADIGRSLGSPFYLILVWVLTGLITLMAALSYGELAGMPKAGGQYVYLRESYNPLVGFLYGWTLFLVIQTGTIAAVAIAFAKFTAVLIPWFGEKNILLEVGFLHISSNQCLAVASVLGLTYINTRGVKTGKQIQFIFTLAKTIALVGLILLGIFVGKNANAISANFSNFWQSPFIHEKTGITWIVKSLQGNALWIAFGGAMVGSLFSSDAWNNITFTAGEVKNPARNIPLSLFLGTLTVTVIYILVNISYMMVLPIQGDPHGNDIVSRGIMFATDDRVATATSYLIFGPVAVTFMAILIMISTFGCNNGLILSGARVYYAMAQDGLFFKKAGTLNKKSVPAYALVVQGIWTCLLCFSGGYGALLDYVIFAVLIFYIFTVVGIFILRKKSPEIPRPYKAWGYPIIPILYILVASAIALDLLIVKWETSRWGLLIVLIGIPVYYLSRNYFGHHKSTASDKD
jgi:basic amino acid/polyamine antiporter, APA family